VTRAAYEARYAVAARTVARGVAVLRRTTTTETLAAEAKRSDTGAAAFRLAARELSSIKPPGDAAADNAAIVAGLRALAAGLTKAKAQILAGNFAAAKKTQATVASGTRLLRAEAAIKDLRTKGYHLEGHIFGS
jgi:hypothetical protein